MGEDRRRCSGEDRISGLPDELLRDILVRLRCARAAARTSVLSRYWRRVWANLPDLVLITPCEQPPASFLDTVDAALDAYSAPTLQRLTIRVLSIGSCPYVPVGRAAQWLHFSSQRVVGSLFLEVTAPLLAPVGEAELELPACGGAEAITLSLQKSCWLRLQPGGSFTALNGLHRTYLRLYVLLINIFDVSIRSDTLQPLWFCSENTRRLEVVVPTLEQLTVYDAIEASISAPKLAELVWRGNAYDPHL